MCIILYHMYINMYISKSIPFSLHLHGRCMLELNIPKLTTKYNPHLIIQLQSTKEVINLHICMCLK